MTILKLSAIGSSTGIVFPQEMLDRMKVEEGDSLYAIETPEGYIILPYDPTVQQELESGREFMERYRDTLKELAK